MSKKHEPIEQNDEDNVVQNSTRSYFYIALGLMVLAAAAFVSAFLTGTIGVYLLIASVLMELAALSFLSTQKKKNNFKGVFYATVVAYVLLALSVLLFAGGLLYTSLR